MNEKYIKDYFRFPCDPIATGQAIVKGDKYRFTILTSRLIRMEYDEQGVFEDRPTQSIWFRNIAVPTFSISKEDHLLKIETEDLVLQYTMEHKFSASTLKISFKDTSKTWNYGQKARHNLKGTVRTLDGKSKAVKLKPGLMAKDGFSILDDSQSLVFNEDFWFQARERPAIDIYFFGYEHNYLDCLKDYYTIAGKTPIIPRYILGNWWSRYWEYDEKELKELLENFVKHEIPLSVCIIDMDWHLVKIDEKYGKGWTGYTWNRDLFPDPQGMLNWIHDKKLKISMNLHPALGIRGHEDCYESVADFMGADKSVEEPIEFDITDPKFVSAYFDLVHHPHEDQGVDFWWLDWQQGYKTKIAGLDPLWALNHLHFYDLGRNGKTRSFIFSRWGGKGNHRYPIGFSGDTHSTWKALDFQPYFTATASNVGYGWWSHDIGGHMWGTEENELYVRWVQFGVFSPILRLHSTKKDFHKREPWSHDYNTLKYIGDAMRLRHQLIPYIYTMANQNYAMDIPLMRPLYYLSPEDKHAYEFKNQYWFGSEMIIAPITKPVNSITQRIFHKFYLPEGSYFNFFNKSFYPGNQIYRRLFKMEEIPVFVKAGAIIPMANDGNKNGCDNPVKLLVEIFPGVSNTFELYEDDGNSEEYRNGDNYVTTFSLNWTEGQTQHMEFSINLPNTPKEYIPSQREFTLIFNAIDCNSIPTFTVDNGDPNLITSDVLLDEHQVKIHVPFNIFTNLKIHFSNLTMICQENLGEQAKSMLFDSQIPNRNKFAIEKLGFDSTVWSEKNIKKLIRKIKIGSIF